MKRHFVTFVTLCDRAVSQNCERQNTSVLQGFLTIYDIYIDHCDIVTDPPLHERAGRVTNVTMSQTLRDNVRLVRVSTKPLNRRGRLGDCSPRPMAVNGRSASLDGQAPATNFPNFPTQEVSHRHQIWWGQSTASRYTTEALQTSLVAPATKRGSKRNWSLRDSRGTAGWLVPRLLPPTHTTHYDTRRCHDDKQTRLGNRTTHHFAWSRLRGHR